MIFFLSKLIFFISEDSQLIWPSWRKFSTVNLQSNELSDYIRKIFSKKFENSPKNDPWIIYGIQGVDTSYVSIERSDDFICFEYILILCFVCFIF